MTLKRVLAAIAVTALLAVHAGAQTQIQYGPPWHLDRIDQRTGTDGLYVYAYSGLNTVAYVLDTGVNPIAELSGKILQRYACVPVKQVNGTYTHECHSAGTWNPPVPQPIPEFGDIAGPLTYGGGSGHGTQVACLIACNTYGAAKNAKIVSYRVIKDPNVPDDPTTNADDHVTEKAVIAALNHVRTVRGALDGRYAVANMSLTFFRQFTDPLITQVETAINDVIAAGVFVVAAATDPYPSTQLSDDMCGFPGWKAWPASMLNVMTVGGMARVPGSIPADARSSTSAYGPCVDLYAPAGERVNGVIQHDLRVADKYGNENSFLYTSGATPLVTAAALMRLQKARETVGVPTPPADMHHNLIHAATWDILGNMQPTSNNRLLFALVPTKTRP